MPSNKRLEKYVNVRVTEEMYEALVQEAEMRRIRLPDLVRMIFSEHVAPRYTISVPGGLVAEPGPQYTVATTNSAKEED